MPDNLRYKVNTGQDVEQYQGNLDAVIAELKGIKEQLRQIGWLQVLHPIAVSILDLPSPPVTNAGSPTLIKLSKVVNGIFIQNNTGVNVFFEFSEAAGPASPLLIPGSNWDKNIHVQSFYIYTAVAQPINVANGIIIRGWI